MASSQVSYAIGVAEPLSVTVFDYGTGSKTSSELNEIVKKNFDLRYCYLIQKKKFIGLRRPGRIVKDLKLKNPIFQQTASYGIKQLLFAILSQNLNPLHSGHFGRDIFTWEQPKNLSF